MQRWVFWELDIVQVSEYERVRRPRGSSEGVNGERRWNLSYRPED